MRLHPKRLIQVGLLFFLSFCCFSVISNILTADIQQNNEHPKMRKLLQESENQDTRQSKTADFDGQGRRKLNFPIPPPPIVPPETFVAIGESPRYPRDWRAHEKDSIFDLLLSGDESSPGQNGAKVVFKDSTPRDMSKWRFRENNYDIVASDAMPLDRSVKDLRHQDCFQVKYDEDLPSTTVVIIFFNEGISALLRTVVSVINRSPARLINEIIMVDDSSTSDEIRELLPKFVKQYFPPIVKLVRTQERSGLTKARMRGSDLAQGDVILFLDSHCEAQEGWLEPLLQRIKDDETNVAMPSHDIIDMNSMEFYGALTVESQGIFNWDLRHDWQALPEFDKVKITSKADPVRSPTMAGGLFAISRKFWEYLGKYDPGFGTWGGENLELSFKTWMCGGHLDIIPCSHVGHIFRNGMPYRSHVAHSMEINQRRLSEVWMDEYKQVILSKNPRLKTLDFGDVSDRIRLRNELKCHNFSWYLQNVVPDMFIPSVDISRHGTLKIPEKNLCLDSKYHTLGQLSVTRCSTGSRRVQQWEQTSHNEIRMSIEKCLERDGTSVSVARCDGKPSQRFILEADTGVIQSANYCLTVDDSPADISQFRVKLGDCESAPKWTFN